MLIRVLPIDKMVITQTFTMARWQIVVKTSEATKPTKTKMTTTTTTNKKQKTKQQQQNWRRGWGLKKQLTEWSSDVVIIIDLRETERGKRLKRVLLRLYHKIILADFYRFTSGRFGAKNRGL